MGRYVKNGSKRLKKELKTLIDSGTFAADELKGGEVSTPVMETFKVKVKSDVSLKKIKRQISSARRSTRQKYNRGQMVTYRFVPLSQDILSSREQNESSR